MLYTDRQRAINLLLLLMQNFELYFINGCINSLIGPGLTLTFGPIFISPG